MQNYDVEKCIFDQLQDHNVRAFYTTLYNCEIVVFFYFYFFFKVAIYIGGSDGSCIS